MIFCQPSGFYANRHGCCRTALLVIWKRKWYPYSKPASNLARGSAHGAEQQRSKSTYLEKTPATLLRVSRFKAFRLRRRLPPLRLWLLLAILLALTFTSLAYDRSVAISRVRLEDIPPLPVADFQRLLVVSPHPDDESLGAGGAIQLALAQGAQVKVVMMTNGDGQPVAPLILRGEVRPRSGNYIETGQQRQAEALAALQILGLPPENVLFLGYPDGGLNHLWQVRWLEDCPWRAPYTRATQSPYAFTYNALSSYCGLDVLNDLRAIITDYRPDLVLLPHPNDNHSDHRAASSFAQLALALESAADPDYRPSVWGYLVHYGYYPQPRGLRYRQALLPPLPLTGPGSEWSRLDLTFDQVKRKAEALEAHATQQVLLGAFLHSFARSNELFAHIPLLDVSPLEYNSIDLFETDMLRQPALAEPAQESGSRFVLPGADLVGLKVGRFGDSVWLMAQTEGPLLPGLRYRILVKFPDGRSEVFTWPGTAQRLGASTFVAHVNLGEWNDPQVLGFAAEVQQRFTLDQTSWRFLILRDLLPDFDLDMTDNWVSLFVEPELEG